FTEATCDNPEVGYEMSNLVGVEHQLDGELGIGETITIMAKGDEEIDLIATKGWTEDDGIFFYEHTFAELDCDNEKEPEPIEPTEIELPTPEFTEATCDNPEVGY